ncbi:MAG: polyprenyl diphosphate synthase [Candidatus Cryptobacteroides sp.]
MENNQLGKVPEHVSIIMDGNGRWAKQRGQERLYGHMAGVESVRSCVKASVEAGVKVLSLYAFSEENWGRPEQEVLGLMSLMVKAMANEMDELDSNGVRFVVLGNRARLDDGLNAEIDRCMARTQNNNTLTLIVFLSYSGKWDILQAAKRLALEMSEHPERRGELEAMGTEAFDKYLVTAGYPDPSLIIRTSGEQRLSNYLLWQGAYSEFYFTDVLWPDFRREQFFEALHAYSKRDRRYGKV